jgi:hypothetical protein
MSNLDNALQQLREERRQSQLHIEKLDSAISVLQKVVGIKNAHGVSRGAQGRGTLSAAARQRIAQAQRARWARIRHGSKPPSPAPKRAGISIPKRSLSVAARRKIAAAQRARWARVKARQPKKAA